MAKINTKITKTDEDSGREEEGTHSYPHEYNLELPSGQWEVVPSIQILQKQCQKFP